MPFICGNVYLLKCYFTQPKPKKKYAVCVCEEKPLFFLISSSPRKKPCAKSQLLVTPTDLSFLLHNSYVNTAEAITCVVPYTCKVLKDYGSMPSQLKQRIKSAASNSVSLPKRFIDIITSKL